MATRPTSRPSWLDSLHQTRQRLQKANRPLRLAFVGVGHELRGDDAAGMRVAQALHNCLGVAEGATANQLAWLVLEGGPAPENVTGSLRRFRPDLVIFVDAAEMGEPAGTIRWLMAEEMDGLSASTHSMPLSVLAAYLTAEVGCQVAIMGIQPADNQIGHPLTGTVKQAVAEIVTRLPTFLLQPALEPQT